MAVAYRSGSNVAAEFGTTLVVPKPADVSSGDLLLVAVLVYESPTPTITAPAGWTVQDTRDVGFVRQRVYSKVATDSEPASYTWTFSSLNLASAVAGAFQHVDSTSPISAVAGVTDTSVSSIAAGSGNVFFFGGYDNASFQFDATGSLTKRTTGGIQQSGSTSSVDVTLMTLLPGPASGTANMTASGSPTVVSNVAAQRFTVVAAGPGLPVNTAPLADAIIEQNTAQTFTWLYSHPDASDAQTQYELRYRRNSGSWITTTVSSAASSHEFASGFANTGSYEWQVRTYDGTLWSDWSAITTFTVDPAPTAPTGTLPPTLTSPIDGALIPADAATEFAWTFHDPDERASQSAYELRYRPSGAVSWTTTLTGTTASTRSVPAGTFQTGGWEWQVRTRDNSYVWSSWSTTASFSTGSQIKHWNGTAWEFANLKVYNGSAWTTATLKRWNGSAWVTA